MLNYYKYYYDILVLCTELPDEKERFHSGFYFWSEHCVYNVS